MIATMKAPNNARGTEALEQLDERAGVDDAAVGQRRQELLVQQLRLGPLVLATCAEAYGRAITS